MRSRSIQAACQSGLAGSRAAESEMEMAMRPATAASISLRGTDFLPREPSALAQSRTARTDAKMKGGHRYERG